MASKDTGFHPSDAEWTRGRAIALADADAIARRQDGLSRKVALASAPPAVQEQTDGRGATSAVTAHHPGDVSEADTPAPTPGQFATMCLAIEDVVTGRGFDVAIPEEVKDYMRNVLMVGGWRGEQE